MADYCTSAEVKAEGRLSITGAEYDTTLASLVTAASRWIDRYCCPGITDAFAATTDSTRHYGPKCIYLNGLALDAPLLSVTTLVNGDGVTVASGYRLMPRNGSIYKRIEMLDSGAGWAFAGGADEVSVTGKWGLSATVPAPIKEACAMLAGWMLKRYQMALADATANADLGEVIYGASLPKQVLALLEPYRVREFL